MKEKIDRLQELLSEAKELIIALEDYITEMRGSLQYNISLETLHISDSVRTRILNALNHNNIYTIKELLKYSSRDVSKFHNWGKMCTKELQEALKRQYNIDWY